MLDLASLAGLREGNRLEFKSAVGGLPNSLWETYSAFANTDGGVIVLGVREEKDGMPVPSGLKNPETVRKQLWDVLNNRKKTSANILVDSDVVADMFEEHPVIVVTVPRASRDDRPVFINNDMFGGSYRRNGEGDYHCTRFDVTAMVRDSYPSNSDKRVLDGISLSALSGETIKAYRNQFDNMRPRHPWSPLSDEEFLLRLGAVGRSREDGELHPTHAGLLMFGEAWSITDEYPDFFLDCRQVTEGRRWDNRITSASGEWSGNVFEFFNRAYRMLVEELPVPFELDANMRRVDDTLQHKAVREALANALVHTDYYGRAGVVAIRYPDRVEVANPGLLRTPADVIRAGGVSDPRNGTLATMFNLLSIGEKAGSGFDVLRQAAASVGKPEPELRELYDPERVYLTLHLETNGLALGTRHKDDASQETASGGRAVGERWRAMTSDRQALVVAMAHDKREIRASDVAALLGVSRQRSRAIVKEMTDAGILCKHGNGRYTYYTLVPESPDY